MPPTANAAAPLTIVALGASAGGVQALQGFFAAMPADPRLAFVVVMHLSAQHQSQMASVLSRSSAMPVQQAQDGILVEPGQVYVIPPNALMGIRERHLTLLPPLQRATPHPIDYFMAALAEDQQERTVGIVLSGTEHDGTVGLKEIKAAGGLTLVQDPIEAQFPGMPRSAIEAGAVDAVLRVERMPVVLLDFLRHAPDQWVIADDRPAPEADVPDPLLQPLHEILSLVYEQTGCDFNWYRRPMLLRRLRRRIGLRGVDGVEAYLALLRASPEELHALLKDFLISVTEFFRQPEAWQALEAEVLAPLLDRGGPSQAVRVWTPGCATGEESYSVAMLLLELGERSGTRRPVQVFGTDIDLDALATARTGAYPSSIASAMAPERLARFFDAVGGGYVVRKALRDSVLFAPQDLVRDPPFSKLDLIICRNVLIYLEPAQQSRILEAFHFSLNPGGALFLGKSESVGQQAELFEPIARSHRIFRRVDTAARLPRAFEGHFSGPSGFLTPPAHARHGVVTSPAEALHQALAGRTPSAALLLDRESRVLFFHGATADYVAPRGVPSTGLARLLRADVRRVALGTVQEARRTGVPAQARLSVLRHAQHVSLQLLAEPVPAGPGEAAMLLMFEQPADGSGGAPASADAERDNEVHRLREDVAAMEREGEAALGELRVAHEEAMSLNEELQSSNEELQTSKEELQSMNEELVSVNAQLEEKIGELERALGDVRNLMDATQVPTLFLDRELRIRRYTEPTRRLFHLIDADMGRALLDIAGRVDDPTLLADAAAVRDGQVPAEREVADVDGRRYLRRLAPYRLRDDRVDGVVVTYLDITVLLRAAADARRLAAVLDSSNDAVLAYDFEGRIRFWNRGACTIYGHDDDAAKELNIAQLEPPSDRGAAMRVATEARQSVASVGPLHARRLTRAGQVLDVSVTVSALKDEAGLPIAVLSTERDLSDTLRLEAEVRFRTMGDLVPALLRIEDAHGRAEYMNAAWVAFTGVPSSERLLGTGWHVYVHPDDLRVLVEQERRSRDGQRRLECDLRLRGHDGVYRWTRSTAVARVDPNGGLLGYICLSVDIQERKLAEQALAQEAARKDEFLAMLAHELRNPLAPIGNAVALIEGSGKEDPKLRWATGVIARQVEQMARLVDDLMDVARVATGKIKLEMTLLDLRAVVERARDLAAPAIAAREQRLRLHLPDAPVHVEGDLVRLTQVVSNLLNNASKYSERGGRIGVVVSAEAQTAVLRVQDNGAGISADMLPRVFDLFSQEDKTLDRAQGGLGIGLALVQRLVTAQGGRVEAHSDGRGRGSEFVVKLPLLSLEASAAPAEQAQGPAPLAVPCRVLIVDDNADSAETLAMLLSHAGHRVETAADGPSALASALEIRPDVIVLDIGLPGMTGYEVAQRLRAEPSMASTFLIALTGYGRPEDAQLAQAAGFDVHLVKPVSPRVLLDLLAQRAARPGPGPGEPARA